MSPRKASGRADASQEVELKFLVDPEALGSLDTLPVIGPRLKRAATIAMVTTYFDTADRRLQKAGVTLRLRRQGKERVLAVKQMEKASIGRGEWQRSVIGDVPKMADLADSPVAKLLGKAGAAVDLQPLFSCAVERCAFTATAGASRIEVARDLGKTTLQDQELPICEVELELKRGKAGDLVAFARKIVAQAPLRLSFISKAERGLLLADGKWGKPKSASPPALIPSMLALPAFLAICRTCLHDFMLNELALAASDNIEGVHQARIAIRRLRAGFSLFAPLIDDRQFEKLTGELEWLSDLLGAARDLDVFVEALATPADAGILSREIERRRAMAHRALRVGLESSRMRLFLLDLAAWLDESTWKGAKRFKADGPVMLAAGRLLDRRLAKLRKRSRDLPQLGPKKRHRIRIAAKKLRYMCEFFAALPAGKAKVHYANLTGALQDLQNSLGALQDATTFADLLAGLVDEAKSALPSAQMADLKSQAKQALGSVKVDRKKKMRKAAKATTTLRKVEPFWLKVQAPAANTQK